jgi:hypothetical protein
MVAEVKKYKNGTIRIKVDCSGVNFFNSEDYIIKTFENGFSLSKPSLDYVGRTYRMTRRKDNYISISTVKDIEDGLYLLDEESDEDICFFINSNYLEK